LTKNLWKRLHVLHIYQYLRAQYDICGHLYLISSGSKGTALYVYDNVKVHAVYMYIKQNILSSDTFASMLISLQKTLLCEQGGKTSPKVLNNAFQVVIGRPVLAECFN